MGRKGGKFKKKDNGGRLVSNSSRRDAMDDDMMNDEIDAFHKNRDIIPLEIDEDVENSDEDDELPVLDFKGKDEEDEDDYIGDEDDHKGLAAKIVRTQKYLQAKFGVVDDEVLEDADEEEQEKVVWGGKKVLYGADVDYEPQSSDDEDAAEEEAEVLKLQSEKAKSLSMEDFGLEDAIEDEADREPTFEEILGHKKNPSKASLNRGVTDEDETSYSIIKKDLNALTKEEQMDAVYSSAPELVGLLSELNDTLDQFENLNPLVEEVRGNDSLKKGKMHYLEVKQLLFQSYCQAIAFYLLLRSEGHPVRDHPVVSRLVEIKSLVDKIKEMDETLPFDVKNIRKNNITNIAKKLVEDTAEAGSDFFTNNQISSGVQSTKEHVEPKTTVKIDSSRSSQNHASSQSQQEEQIGVQSMEMLKIRASLEEKLRQKGLYSSISVKTRRPGEPQKPVNRQLETIDDFVDEAIEIDKSASQSHLGSGPQYPIPKSNKRKAISGDDDIPRRDDIGERRRKHELRVLAGAGMESVDAEPEGNSVSADEADDLKENDSDSDLEYYNQMEKQHAAKRALKSVKNSRTREVSYLPDTVEGKRQINYQIEKNRGLTRTRNKLTKNPRKKYKLKHKKALVRRKGQVRDVRKQIGNYGGEASGINAAISRSIRLK